MARRARNSLALLLALFALVLLQPRPAAAFCGFYVSGASAELRNEATTVILMRDGTRTVLSMQNNYRGPAQDFAMVVPVPVVLDKDDVKVLDADVFERIDRLSSPRLVEYWERDPCQPDHDDDYDDYENPLASSSGERSPNQAKPRIDTVTVEARFAVGEYAIEILSAENSLGLDSWLREQGYVIPANAAELLEPYVQAGSKFFVAKVDVRKVRFEDGLAKLSPLRIHYDAVDFSLPVRLGLINAEGPQDLIVHILAPGLRYETSNYDTISIPTNVEVDPETAAAFGTFYAALFDHTVAANPGAVVLEYAWGQPSPNRSSFAGKCDPCPDGLWGLSFDDLLSLGLDMLPTYSGGFVHGRIDRDLPPLLPGDFVHTRMHARYAPGDRVEDLVFHATGAVYGGTESERAFRRPSLEEDDGSRFQARYVIHHRWAGSIHCDAPIHGRWDGSPPSVRREVELGFDPRNAELSDFVSQDELDAIDEHLGRGGLPKFALDPKLYSLPRLGSPVPPELESGGCGHCDVAVGVRPWASLAYLGPLGLLGLLSRSRRRRDRWRGGARD